MKVKGQPDLKSQLSSQQRKETDKAHSDTENTNIFRMMQKYLT